MPGFGLRGYFTNLRAVPGVPTMRYVFMTMYWFDRCAKVSEKIPRPENRKSKKRPCRVHVEFRGEQSGDIARACTLFYDTRHTYGFAGFGRRECEYEDFFGHTE